MKQDIQRLPGVKEIGYIYSWELPKRIDLLAIVGSEIVIMANRRNVPFFGEPSVKLTTKKENHAYTEEAVLEFTSADIPFPLHDIAFVVRDIEDNFYIIGSKEEPGIDIEIQSSLGAPSGESKAFAVKITHKSIRALVKINSIL